MVARQAWLRQAWLKQVWLRQTWLVLAFAVVLCGGAAAARADDYPAEVKAAIAEAKKYCEDNGGKFSFPPSAVHKVELNGDKRDDYIVDFNDATCEGADGGLCGTGGCEISILVALHSGRLVTVFDMPVLSYEVLPATHSMRFQMHGGYCGQSGGGSHCMKTHRITTKLFRYEMPE
jgi:hypothetical protein